MGKVTSKDRFKCKICLKCYSSKQSLEHHERIHSGEKPFQCEVCDKTFAQKGNLDRHMRIHSGEKPYECDICGKKFSVSCHLKYHSTTHSDFKSIDGKIFKKLKCVVCGKLCPLKNDTEEKKVICERCKSFFTKDQLSAIIKSEASENEESVASTSHNLTHFVDCGDSIKKEINEEVEEKYQFVDCDETIKQEIKQENETEIEIAPLTVKTEHCDEFEAKSIDCKQTIKLEIKQESKDS